MADPLNQISSGWRPTVSTITGASVGGSIAYLIIIGFDKILHQTGFDPVAYIALTSICNFVIGYISPDGGRK